jgi:hypothetical protein
LKISIVELHKRDGPRSRRARSGRHGREAYAANSAFIFFMAAASI